MTVLKGVRFQNYDKFQYIINIQQIPNWNLSVKDFRRPQILDPIFPKELQGNFRGSL